MKQGFSFLRLIGIVFSLFVVFYLYLNGSLLAEKISAAQATSSLSGYAWSSDIGWIKFNGNNYGVKIDPSTGALSGYAWSSNIGWIKFDTIDNLKLSQESVPESPQKGATLNLTTNVVEGWARAVTPLTSGLTAVTQCPPCVYSIPRCLAPCRLVEISSAGGWDGWIKMSGNAINGNSYGVKYNPLSQMFSGYAWGGDVVGWINFSGTNYAVKAKLPSSNNQSNSSTSTISQPSLIIIGTSTIFQGSIGTFISIYNSGQPGSVDQQVEATWSIDNSNTASFVGSSTGVNSVQVQAASSAPKMFMLTATYTDPSTGQTISTSIDVIINNVVCGGGQCDCTFGNVSSEMNSFSKNNSTTAQCQGSNGEGIVIASTPTICQQLGYPNFFWSPAQINALTNTKFLITRNGNQTIQPSSIEWRFDPSVYWGSDVVNIISGSFSSYQSISIKFGPASNVSRIVTMTAYSGSDYCQFTKKLVTGGRVEY